MNINKSLKEWPVDDRPREKLFLKGEKNLSDSELLAIILRTGMKGKSAVDLSRDIIIKFGSFKNLSNAQENDWKAFKGIGNAKLSQIRATMEIGRRLWENDSPKLGSKVLDNSKIAVDAVMPRLRDANKEIFIILLLDSRNRLIEIIELTQGTVNEVRPILREIFHEALKKFSSSIICAHNHPSGDFHPSPEDVNLTKEIDYVGKIMNIILRDHIIIAGNRYYSFADEGLLN